jgi:signal transduction histidine kinase
MVVVAVALTLGSIGLLAVYRNQLLSSLDTTLAQQVDDRVRLLNQGNPPEPLAGVLEEESLVWIGTADGAPIVTGGSLRPVGNPVPTPVGGVGTVELMVDEVHAADNPDGDDDGDDGDGEAGGDGFEREIEAFRLASGMTDGGLVVLAGTELDTVDDAAAAIGRLFAIGVPPVVLLVGALTWLTTGRALRPVENIRSKAAEVTGSNLTGRVPVPGGDDEITDLANTVNAMLGRIEAHEASLRQFTADASHELKSPVANLRALIDTATVDDPAWPRLKRHLLGESDRLKDLVENLLFLASADAGRPTEAPQPVALDELVFVEAEVAAATGTVAVDLAGVQPATVDGSSAELARLIRNLVDNAARHAEHRIMLAITVGSHPDGDDEANRAGVTLVVGDDGPGIRPEDRAAVFGRFTRLDDARDRSDGGAGLGLAIVKHIADTHRADIAIGRSPLGGAEFTVRFAAV